MEEVGVAGLLGLFMTIFLISLVLSIIVIASMWTLFNKAGKPGWAAIVPIYSTLVLLEIIKKPWWWLLLMLIPLVNIVYAIWATNLFVKSFGKDEGFTVGVLLLPYVFYPILAFNKDTRYIHNTTNEFNTIGTNEV
ncbi:DUF5684 domain-containing protein [Flavobacterium suzhouense]|uniref:DUF5684 domain-containing protein n=1 Tax=Flavobacterium suzhouense TaxID=1529638 RepID=A0ABW5NUA3_9FLAO